MIGPESTGKSTLSGALAHALHTVWVPEYAREYLIALGRQYHEPDLLKIAKGQLALEDRLSTEANRYLICDTDLNVIKVWAEHKYGRCHRWILEQIAARTYDHYLLTDIDIDWIDDPLRENPGHWRSHFFNTYYDIVQQSGVPFTVISGSQEARLQKAMAAIAGL